VIPFSRFARYFIEVSRQGSLRKAAEALHVSASSIDRQILRAEEELETRLFERLPTGLKLTSAGELLLDDMRRWRKDYGRTLQRIDDLKGLKRGHVGLPSSTR
jgi:DNA-binding transcriptional LysR family regulator